MAPSDGVAHADPEVLAALALGEAVDDGSRDHVTGCPHCRREVEQLADLADAARAARQEDLVDPPPAVWLGVAARLAPAAPAPADAQPSRRRTPWLVAASVVLALVAGLAAGWTLARRDDDRPGDVVATTPLESLTGGQDRGSAEVLWTPGHTSLRVEASRLPATTGGVHEVWLLNEDGRRMVALGLLPGADRGTFALPQRLLDEGYRIVDISVEPDDGDPAHSGDSVARGTLEDG